MFQLVTLDLFVVVGVVFSVIPRDSWLPPIYRAAVRIAYVSLKC